MELMELIATVGAALIQPVIAVAVVLIIISSTKNKNYKQRGSFASELYGNQKWEID